jgi:hypothetical protein
LRSVERKMGRLALPRAKRAFQPATGR